MQTNLLNTESIYYLNKLTQVNVHVWAQVEVKKEL